MPRSPLKSSIISLMLAGEAFSRLTPTNDVLDAYLNIRETLCGVIGEITDSTAYAHSWHFFNNQAQVSLMKFMLGNMNALDELKERVRTSIELMP